ncbi:uncharacterized protein [Clytia hemisphaerica]|uniref:uncharacterized protein n=1 Tax=Clytia hemisphaerica TaxID=252671 RepID=UPI0034D74EFB
MVTEGKKAVEFLGEDPNKDSQKYKKYTHQSFGQWGSVLFEGTIIEFVPPCGLHLILAHHRYLWKVLHRTIMARKQEQLIAPALRKIGCHYLAFQLDSYFKSKKKYYDGSETLRMIGNDCKLFEDNIDTFLNVFIAERNQSWNDESSERLRHVLKLYKRFKDLARDIRSTHADKERISSFGKRAEEFFRLFVHNAPTDSVNGMPYLHYLRHHLADEMELFSRLFGWGYGIFSTNAGEHLNKVIKQYEMHHTNLDSKRFYTIIQMIRSKQFEYTESIYPKEKTIICSACNQSGHNRKNKSCPLHSSHPRIEFEDSEEESKDEQ